MTDLDDLEGLLDDFDGLIVSVDLQASVDRLEQAGFDDQAILARLVNEDDVIGEPSFAHRRPGDRMIKSWAKTRKASAEERRI